MRGENDEIAHLPAIRANFLGHVVRSVVDCDCIKGAAEIHVKIFRKLRLVGRHI